MKKFLCFLGILSLIILIALPPTLRLLVPKENKEEEKKEELIIKALSCDGDNYIARTRYENDIVKMILIKKNGVSSDTEDSETPSETLDSQEENEETQDENNTSTTEPEEESDTNQTNPETSPNLDKFEEIFTRLSEDSRIVRDDMEDGVTLTIDLSIYTESDFDIGDITKPINDQKIYYEDLGLTCSIIE